MIMVNTFLGGQFALSATTPREVSSSRRHLAVGYPLQSRPQIPLPPEVRF